MEKIINLLLMYLDPLIDIKLSISIPLLMKLELKSSKMLLYFWEILLCRATNNATVITTKNKKLTSDNPKTNNE